MPTASAPRVSAYVYRIPLYFLLVSLFWVLVTDKVLDLFILDHLEEAWLQTAKETALLLAVTVLLHRFLRAEDRLQQETLARLRDSEAEADEKRRLLEAVIAASPLPMIILDSQGLVRQWSPAAERVFGWTGAETLGKPLPYMDASLEEENSQHASLVLSGQTILGKHIVRRCKHGKRLDLMLNAAPVSLGERGVVGAMAMFEDVTEKKRLQTERDMFFANSVDMLCIARTDGFFQQINPAWTKTLGWSEAELLTTPWLEFVHPEDRPDTELVRQWLSQGNPYRYFENRYRHKDGSWRWLAWSSMVPSDGNLIFAVARDITEERQARENLTRALEAANAATAAKDAFLMNIGHELRTPLHGILGMVQLGMRENDPLRHAEFWKTAGDSARSLLETINNLLDLTAIEAGDITPTPRSFSPATLLDVLFQQYAQRAGAKGLGFSLRVDPALPAAIFADEGFHRRILMSLLDNALRFTPQGSVSLEAELLADATMATGAIPRLRYTVRDTGVGVAPNRQQHIFERFGLAEDYLTKRYGGAGVGLSIAAKLVHALDGTVSLDSRPGEGSIFTVVLPAPPVQEEAPTPDPCPAGPRVVLVVEDEAVSRLWLGLTLRRHGCQVLEADSGEAALAELGRSRVDVVLLDIQMPGVDGLEVLRRIRSGETGAPRDLSVIVTTAHTSRGDRARYREAGMTDMLSKPFTVSELVAVLGRVGIMARDAGVV